MKTSMLALIFAFLACCAQAGEVASFIRHNGLVSELISLEHVTIRHDPPRFIAFTSTCLIYELMDSDDQEAKDAYFDASRITAWRVDGKNIILYNEFGEPVFTSTTDAIEYKYFEQRDYNEIIRTDEKAPS